jgi:hypothetical protein
MAKKTKTVRGTTEPRFAQRVKESHAWQEQFATDPEARKGVEEDIAYFKNVIASHAFTEREILFVQHMAELFDDKFRWITPHRAAVMSGYKSPVMGSRLMKRPHIIAVLTLAALIIRLGPLAAKMGIDEPMSELIKIAKRDRDGD